MRSGVRHTGKVELDMKAHLEKQAEILSRLPWRSIHQETGLPVWLMLALVADARERVERGAIG